MSDEQDTENNLIKVVVGGVVSFVGLCFLAVSIWLATTVSNLSRSSATLELSITNLTKQTEKLAEKVDTIAEDQKQSSINVYRVQHLEGEVLSLKKRVKELETK